MPWVFIGLFVAAIWAGFARMKEESKKEHQHSVSEVSERNGDNNGRND